MVVVQLLQRDAQDSAVEICDGNLGRTAGPEAEILVPQNMRQVVHTNIGQAPLKQPAQGTCMIQWGRLAVVWITSMSLHRDQAAARGSSHVALQYKHCTGSMPCQWHGHWHGSAACRYTFSWAYMQHMQAPAATGLLALVSNRCCGGASPGGSTGNCQVMA